MNCNTCIGFCRGKIRYFTQPPEVKDESHVSASIVKEAAAEFDLDSFKDIEAETLNQMEESNGVQSKKSGYSGQICQE